MIPRGLIAIVVLNIIGCHAQLIFPKNASRKPRANSNRIVDIDTSCSKDSMDVRVNMERPFKGVVFAKDFSRECTSQGKLNNSITLRLPPNACGVRVGTHNTANSTANDLDSYDEDLFYVVTVVVQMDKFLQQSSDQERTVRCWLKPRAMQIKSYIIEEMIQKKIRELSSQHQETEDAAKKKGYRTGRMGGEWTDISEEEQASIMEQARAWMEISPSNGNIEATAVEVGEPTMIVIKSTLPAGVGFRITDCLAHDGLGESSQRLLDDLGCPVDELIFPRMKVYHHHQNENHQPTSIKSIMSYKHATTTFSAFKFPDRARLHLTCGLELCKGECRAHDCVVAPEARSKDALRRRVRLDREPDGLVIDRLQVYNSIEVLAPNIELEDDASIQGTKQIGGRATGSVDDIGDDDSSPMSADKTVCMSPSKMALAFCILGLVFLSALVVAFVSLIRARRRYGGGSGAGGALSFYTGSKSVFSGSGGSSSNSGFSGSKLLLTDSPYMEDHHHHHHHHHPPNWPYGRVL